ncbi:MAG: formate dehydrogenase [Comamonas sp.]
MSKPNASSHQQPAALSRRSVFIGAGATGAALVAATVVPQVASGPVAATAPVMKTPDPQGGYQLTEHVRRYYQTAKV